MKKTKIFAVLGVCLAMGLTACGGNTNSDSPKSSAAPSSTSSRCSHDWGTWVPGTAATCTQDGTRSRTCSKCGEVQNGTVNKLGHDFSVFVSDTSTCEADGKVTYKCSRCDEKEVKDIKAHHRIELSPVAAGEGTVGYKAGTCSVCGIKGVEIRALDGTLASGSTIKSGTADGYMKLSSNDQSISWKFNLELGQGKTGAVGKIYQRGFMDAWSSNSTKTYGYYTTSGNSTREKGNFDLTVNGVEVDKSPYITKTFEELTAGGEDSSSVGDNYSPIALIPIGEMALSAGENTIVFKRTGSYNFVISDLVMYFTEFAHEHQAATAWSSDASQHWHACVAADCPVEGGYKMDAADHEWAADWAPVEGQSATCAQPGKESRTCSVCGYVATRDTDKLPHDYDVAKGIPADETLGTIASTVYKCKVCGDTTFEWAAKDFDATDSKEVSSVDSDGGVKMVTADKSDPSSTSAGGAMVETTVGTKYVYKLNLHTAAQNVGLSFKIKTYNGGGNCHVFASESGDYKPGYVQNEAGEWVKSPFRYGVSVNGRNVPLGEDTYGNSSSLKGKTDWFDFKVNFDVNAGLNTIEILCLGGYPAEAIYNYRITGLPEIEIAHVHTLGDWQYDANEHWKLCLDPECEAGAGAKLEKANHTWVADESKTDVPATCDAAGIHYVKCECGAKSEQPIAQLGHNLSLAKAGVNADNKEVKVYSCSVGEEKMISIAAKDASKAYKTTRTVTDDVESIALGDEISVPSSLKLDNSQGTTLMWKINLTAAISNARIEIGTQQYTNIERYFYNHVVAGLEDKSSNPDTTSQDHWRYYAKVNTGEFAHIDCDKTMNEVVGKDVSKVSEDYNKNYMPLGTFNLVEGENLIYLRQGSIGYRLTFERDLRIVFKGDADIQDFHVHNYERAVTTPATCTTDGLATFTCACGDSYTEAIPAGHAWAKDNDASVSGEGVVNYDVYKCGNCTAIKVEVKAVSGVFAEGSAIKDGTPDGYLKLSGANQKVTYTFNLDLDGNPDVVAEARTAKLYQRGFIDGWGNGTSGNATKYVFTGGSSSAGPKDPDCEIKFNSSTALDLTPYQNKKFNEVLPAGSGNNSPVGDVECGTVSVVDGVNTFSYERLKSYNLSISYFVIVLE